MKIFRHRNLMGCIYALLMAIPFAAVAVKCAYVVVNKNANQSYSGKNQSNMILQNVDSFEKDKQYNLQTHINTYDNEISEAQNYLVASKLFFNDSVYTNIRIGFYRVSGSTVANVYLRELDNNNNLIYTGNLANTNLQLNVSFIYDYQTNTFSDTLYQFFNYQDFMTNYYQDNVFYYAIDEITNNEIGNVHFFDWFSNMFLTNNATNNRFIGYVNWYMNYSLLVSCAFILFLVLMWMINFARRLLERGMNYDF